jgi:hypothetical protein
MLIPQLERAPVIDGDLDDWRQLAFHDGVWDIYRVVHSRWYDPARNRLTGHGEQAGPADDLQARYYIAWDGDYLYLGADVRDNVNDVADPQHEPKRWYYKDAICWFIEAPRDSTPERFGRGDNAFCYVIDKNRPGYAAWWRHGTAHQTYVEEPLTATDYVIRMLDPGSGNFQLEARVAMSRTFAVSDPEWKEARIGDELSLEIVHTDPDGGDYGGHLILYGTGDEDETWGRAVLAGPATRIERRDK